MIRHPCPSDPNFPKFDDYELMIDRAEERSGEDWCCYARPKTEMARKVSLDVVHGKSEEDVKKNMGATYLYRAGRMTNQEWFKIQMGVGG